MRLKQAGNHIFSICVYLVKSILPVQVVALFPLHTTVFLCNFFFVVFKSQNVTPSVPDSNCPPPSPGQFAENETNEVNFREIPSHVLSKVCMYFTYKVRYTNSSTEIPEFPIAPEIALELLMAANFLDC